MKKSNTMRIGCVYNLNKKYKDAFTHAIISIDLDTRETVIKLFSNWSSSYDVTERYDSAGFEPLDVINEYQAK